MNYPRKIDATRWFCDGCQVPHDFPAKINYHHEGKFYCINTYPGRKLQVTDGMRVRTTENQNGIQWLADCIPAGTLATVRMMKLNEGYDAPVPTLHFDGYSVSRDVGHQPFCTLRYSGEYVLSDWFEIEAQEQEQPS